MSIVKHRNLVLLGIFVLIVGTVITLVVYNCKKKTIEDKKPVKVVSEVGKIEGFDYKLEDRDTKLYKDNFAELKSLLENEIIDYQEYAKIISKMYIIDLYTINNKINQYDVGGLEFIHPEAKESFDLKVRETMYRFIEDDTYGKRTQNLPEVSSIEVLNIKEEKQSIKENSFEGYSVELTWDYVSDLGYDNKAILNLVKVDNMIYIIKHDEKQSSSE